jgi:hypothetical protein
MAEKKLDLPDPLRPTEKEEKISYCTVRTDIAIAKLTDDIVPWIEWVDYSLLSVAFKALDDHLNKIAYNF